MSPSSSPTLQIKLAPIASKFFSAVVTGQAREIGCFGTRGDGKTITAAAAMVGHAYRHQAAGFPLPTEWIGATDTFKSHELKTHRSLMAPLWRGCWRLEKGGGLAVFRLNGVDLVHLHLVGVGDESGYDRLRAECHGIWFEEPAPAQEIGALGMTENHWGMGITSMRLPSHANVAMFTSNYPDDEHWTWTRFHEEKLPGTMMFEIPKGENPYVTPEMRAQWAEAIRDPIMKRRLLEGKPGTIMSGRPVAYGFNEDLHVSRVALRPRPGGEIWIGQDGGLMPASVIAQRANARIEILASLSSEHAGMRQHLRYVLRPWLGEHAPWTLEQDNLLKIVHDPTLDTAHQGDSETNALRVMREVLPARYIPGVNNPWSWRRDPLLAALASMDDGQPLVVLDPQQCKPLIKAWRGLWHYAVTAVGDIKKEEPKKPNPPWADLGDASAYLIAGMAPTRHLRPKRARALTYGSWNPLSRGPS